MPPGNYEVKNINSKYRERSSEPVIKQDSLPVDYDALVDRKNDLTLTLLIASLS
jgi:hypothetical protein